MPNSDASQLAAAHGPIGRWLRSRFAAWTSRDDVADDLLQRTWVGVWQSMQSGRYDPQRSSLATFAYAVGRNVYRHWARSNATEAASRKLAVSPDEVEWPSDIALAEQIDRIRALLFHGRPGLSAQEIEVLQHVARGGTDRELALALGVSPSTAHDRKRTALESLRRCLESASNCPSATARYGKNK